MRKKIVSDDFERLYRNQVFVIEKKKKNILFVSLFKRKLFIINQIIFKYISFLWEFLMAGRQNESKWHSSVYWLLIFNFNDKLA